MAVNCGAVETPIFQPAMRQITAVTQANPAAVTTAFDHNYITGEIVRLVIPNDHGMIQANDMVGKITVTADTTFTIDINTIEFEPFVVPASAVRCSQVIPVGGTSVFTATRNTLPSGNR